MVVPLDADSTLSTVIRTLSLDGIAILPCDTMYGLCGAAPRSAERLKTVKKRDSAKEFIVLIADEASVSGFSRDRIDSRLLSLWPAPLTIIVKGNDDDTVALRMPESVFLRRIIEKAGPIYSTSVNISGEPYLWRIDDIITEFGSQVDLIVDAGDLAASMPSTILDISSTPWRIVRQGSFELPVDFGVGP